MLRRRTSSQHGIVSGIVWGWRPRDTIDDRGTHGDILRRHGGYTIRWYEGGRRRTRASRQTSYADARRMLFEIEARVARGEAGIAERRSESLSVAELAERFLHEYSRPRIKDLARYRYSARIALNRVLPLLNGRADAVTASEISRARDALRQQHADGTARLSLNYLATVFSWGVKRAAAQESLRRVERPPPTAVSTSLAPGATPSAR